VVPTFMYALFSSVGTSMFGIVAPTSILANNVRPANAFARARALLLAAPCPTPLTPPPRRNPHPPTHTLPRLSRA
jgi:hypothetical protein